MYMYCISMPIVDELPKQDPYEIYNHIICLATMMIRCSPEMIGTTSIVVRTYDTNLHQPCI